MLNGNQARHSKNTFTIRKLKLKIVWAMRDRSLNAIEIEIGGALGRLGNFGETFNLGYFDGGTRLPEVGEPIGADYSADKIIYMIYTYIFVYILYMFRFMHIQRNICMHMQRRMCRADTKSAQSQC